jgi:hypothetical protein
MLGTEKYIFEEPYGERILPWTIKTFIFAVNFGFIRKAPPFSQQISEVDKDWRPQAGCAAYTNRLH